MKKILIVVSALVLLAVVGVVFFVATFDADRYRPLVVKKIEEATGKKVALDRVSLVWKNGIAFEVKNFKLFSGVPGESKILAQFERVTAAVRLVPLLRKDIQVISFTVVKPFAEVRRNPDGSFSISGIEPPAAKESKPTDASSTDAGVTWSVDSFRIEQGELSFQDLTGSVPLNVSVQQLDLSVRQFSLTQPISFEAKAALFSAKQNISLSGNVEMPQKDRVGFLKDFMFETELGLLDVAGLVQIFPSLKAAGLKEKISGHVQVKVDSLSLHPEGLAEAKAEIQIHDAEVSLATLPQPVQRLNADLFYEDQKLQIKDISCHFAGGDIKMSGTVDQPLGRALSKLQFSAQGLVLQALMPIPDGKSGLTGALSVEFEGQSSGKEWGSISQTLTGQGRLVLRDGLLLNYNVLRVVVQKLANIPVIGEPLLRYFPLEFRQDLEAPSTILKPVDLSFSVSGGNINLPNVMLGTSLFDMNGAGQLGFDKSVGGNFSLWMNPRLSQALMQIAPQIQILANAQGLLEIPLTLQGVLPNISVLPDVEYLKSKIVSAKTQEIVAGLVTDPKETLNRLGGLVGKNSQALVGSSQ